MPVDALQVATLVLLVAALAVGGWALWRARRRSREIQAQLEELGRGLGRLEAALAAEERERARQDEGIERRVDAALGPLLERLVELGRVQREAARVARAVAEGQVAPGVGVQLERHLAELAADLATDEAPES